MSDSTMLMDGRDPEMAGAQAFSTPRPSSSPRLGLRRVLVAAGAIATLALGTCLLLRPTGLAGLADAYEPMQAADVDATEELDDQDACDRYPYLKFEKVIRSNLGGHGPDGGHEGIVYLTKMIGKAAGDDLGEEVALVLHAKGDYHPAAAGANGMQGEYGSVNIMHGTHVDIDMSVRHAVTGEPLTIPHVAFTFFDLDEGPDGKCRESVTVGGFTDLVVTDDTEVVQHKEDDGRTAFLASTFGTGDDNPKNPMFLTSQQKNRAVSVIFDEFHKHTVTLKAEPGETPRFFTFIGRPSLLCAATVQEGYVPPSTTLPPKYPPLKYGPVGLKPVVAPTGKTFVKWMVGMHQRVEVGETIAILAPHHFEVKATHAGKVVAKAPLEKGDVIDDRMVDHNIATLDETLPPLPFDPDAGEDEEMAKKPEFFLRWLKDVGDPVEKGDPIAQVSVNTLLHLPLKLRKKVLDLSPEKLHPVGGFPAGLGQVVTIKATESGFVKATEALVAGDVIGEIKEKKAGAAGIAVISPAAPGTPWWLWLLLATVAAVAAAIIFMLLMKPEIKKETYKPVPPIEEKKPEPPPPPPPVVKDPPGLKLAFDDKGSIKTVFATMRPLGLTCKEGAPIVVEGFTFNSYGKTLGVQPGWTLVQVGAVDVKPIMSAGEVKALVNAGLKPYPVYPLAMTFNKAGTSETKSYEFAFRPLGFEFDNKAPIKVKRVYPNSYSHSLGMKDHVKDNETWSVTKIAELDVAGETDFSKIFDYMKDGTKALDPYTETDGRKAEDQFFGWD